MINKDKWSGTVFLKFCSRTWKGKFYWFFLGGAAPCHVACGILVPWPRTKPGPSAVKTRSPNHYTSRAFPKPCFTVRKWSQGLDNLPKATQQVAEQDVKPGSLTQNPYSWPLYISHARLFVTPWTSAHQSPLSMGFSRQEYWSGLPFPSPGDLPNPGIKLGSPTLQADSLPSEPSRKPLLYGLIHLINAKVLVTQFHFWLVFLFVNEDPTLVFVPLVHFTQKKTILWQNIAFLQG